MRLEKYLQEKYAFGLKGKDSGKYTEVFVNPSKSEMFELGGIVRFTALDNKKKVYVWKAILSLHYDIERAIPGLNAMSWKTEDYIFAGEAGRQDNYFTVYNSDQIRNLIRNNIELARKILKKDWSWLKKYYIDPTDWLKKYRKRYLLE